MKAGFKYGLGVVVGLFFSVVAMASEPVPIEDKDAFEKQYIDCLKSGFKDKCFSALFSSHLTLGADRVSLDQADSFYKNESLVYEIHVLDKVIRAGVFDSSTYLIERTDAVFAGADVTFMKLKGAWYVYSYSVNTSSEFVLKILNLPAY